MKIFLSLFLGGALLLAKATPGAVPIPCTAVLAFEGEKLLANHAVATRIESLDASLLLPGEGVGLRRKRVRSGTEVSVLWARMHSAERLEEVHRILFPEFYDDIDEESVPFDEQNILSRRPPRWRKPRLRLASHAAGIIGMTVPWFLPIDPQASSLLPVFATRVLLSVFGGVLAMCTHQFSLERVPGRGYYLDAHKLGSLLRRVERLPEDTYLYLPILSETVTPRPRRPMGLVLTVRGYRAVKTVRPLRPDAPADRD